MSYEKVYDIIGIGIGPFNLGLAALADSIPGLNCLFVDQNKEFNWHPGLMLSNARLQVPFYADLVTIADPCSKFSFLAFLKAKQRMFRFAILENNFILRKEYNEYCRWVAKQLPNLYFGHECKQITFNGVIYAVHTNKGTFSCKNIVIGVGTVPYIPKCAKKFHSNESLVFHSSDYLYFKERLLTKKSVSIIGSGQSAAEIFYDLLLHSAQFNKGLNWFTRTDGFSPMDYSSFALEKTSPDYIEHFYSLSFAKKKERLRSQNHLYKGINASLISDIYNELSQQYLSQPKNHVSLHPNSELKSLSKKRNDEIELSFYHSEKEQDFTQCSEAVILATGYMYQPPAFIEPVKNIIQLTKDGQYNVNRNYSIDPSNSIFVQNAELHTHGFNAPDLGMGPYRNTTILNSILGYEHFIMEKNIAFQKFGFPTA